MPFLRGLRSRSASDPHAAAPARPPAAPSPAVPIPPMLAAAIAANTAPAAPPGGFRPGDLALPVPAANHFYRTLSAPLLSTTASAPPEYAPRRPTVTPVAGPVQPREEEGCEQLPPYSSTLLRAAVLSRKMELLSPLETAPVRSWQTVIAVLNNTQLNIYKAPATLHPVGSGAQAAAAPVSRVVAALPWRSASVSDASSSAASAATPAADTIDPFSWHPSASSSNASSASSLASLSPACSPSSTGFPSPCPSPAMLLGLPESMLAPSRLIRSYTLQYAQIGLATDYKKKSNVIRVRAEGQQFLFLCADARECIEWTASMHAACDLALPLDERTIPRYRTIPSRRRRRVLPSARHTSYRSAARRAAEEAAEAADAVRAVREVQAADAVHEEEDEEDELYYRRRTPATTAIHEHENSDEEDYVATSPSSAAPVVPSLSVSPSSFAPSSMSSSPGAGRMASAFANFTIFEDEGGVDESDDDAKWAPSEPTLSTYSKLRYAVRCMYTLPANSSWGDKLLMAKGDQFIVRERILVR
ncbi:uncharacterized protein V1518DRAFT_295961 [Limtongia smithiae]|uniref:uncharacterized protein n=1 Tax=Limtongia smithiae TaxID=1125753 RepID=UPI0034CFF5BD